MATVSPTSVSLISYPSTPVAYLSCEDNVATIQATYRRLESLFTSFHDLNLHGVYFCNGHLQKPDEYRACLPYKEGDQLKLNEDSDIKFSDLQRDEIHGGWYVLSKLTGSNPGIYDKIPETVTALRKFAYGEGAGDEENRINTEEKKRGNVEFYKGLEEVWLMVPVTKERVAQLEELGVKKIWSYFALVSSEKLLMYITSKLVVELNVVLKEAIMNSIIENQGEDLNIFN